MGSAAHSSIPTVDIWAEEAVGVVLGAIGWWANTSACVVGREHRAARWVMRHDNNAKVMVMEEVDGI